MSEVVPNDPEPLPLVGDFFTWDQESDQPLLRAIVSDIEELTEGREQRVVRRLGHFCIQEDPSTTTNITLISYGLYEKGRHYSEATRDSLPPDNRAAEILIRTFVKRGKERTASDEHYGIIKMLGGSSLRMIEKTRYKDGPDYFVSPSPEKIRDVNEHIQQLKPTPPQAD